LRRCRRCACVPAVLSAILLPACLRPPRDRRPGMAGCMKSSTTAAPAETPGVGSRSPISEFIYPLAKAPRHAPAAGSANFVLDIRCRSWRSDPPAGAARQLPGRIRSSPARQRLKTAPADSLALRFRNLFLPVGGDRASRVLLPSTPLARRRDRLTAIGRRRGIIAKKKSAKKKSYWARGAGPPTGKK
jgi:hypothetical protein